MVSGHLLYGSSDHHHLRRLWKLDEIRTFSIFSRPGRLPRASGDHRLLHSIDNSSTAADGAEDAVRNLRFFMIQAAIRITGSIIDTRSLPFKWLSQRKRAHGLNSIST